jgi:hypothetical protein
MSIYITVPFICNKLTPYPIHYALSPHESMKFLKEQIGEDIFKYYNLIDDDEKITDINLNDSYWIFNIPSELCYKFKRHYPECVEHSCYSQHCLHNFIDCVIIRIDEGGDQVAIINEAFSQVYC